MNHDFLVMHGHWNLKNALITHHHAASNAMHSPITYIERCTVCLALRLRLRDHEHHKSASNDDSFVMFISLITDDQITRRYE